MENENRPTGQHSVVNTGWMATQRVFSCHLNFFLHLNLCVFSTQVNGEDAQVKMQKENQMAAEKSLYRHPACVDYRKLAC